jgi:uncharacterized membrane protein
LRGGGSGLQYPAASSGTPDMDTLVFIVTFVAALGSGLNAGVFFAFSTFVMRALGRLPPPQGIAAMQAINVTAISPLFMLVFLGTGLLSLALGVEAVLALDRPGALYRLVGSVVYLAGSIGVTMACNVPRNNALAGADGQSREAAELWAGYQVGWTAWNHVRTLACLAAAALFTAGLWA